MVQQEEQQAETLVLPRVVAFDLDGTLWMPEMDTLWGGAPFKKGNAPGQVIDSRGETVELIGASLEVLRHIATDPAWQSVEVAYVSRTTEVDTATACLHALEVLPGRSMHSLATHLEIFPGRKTTHFENIRKRTGHEFGDMLFFDNERRNVLDCNPMGVVGIYCPRGLTSNVWQDGLATYRAVHPDGVPAEAPAGHGSKGHSQGAVQRH